MIVHAFLCSAPTTSTTHSPIEYPEELTGTHFNLTIDEYTYLGPTVTQRTRAYNAGIVGPTLRIQPGSSVTITLTNGLDARALNTGYLQTQFGDLSTTNLHTHGLHVSGEAPGDDVFVEVAPAASHAYTYDVPADHMGGTFWYHSHKHGNTAIQTGGGACGMLIVEDPPGYLPPGIAAMQERAFVMQHLNMLELTAVAKQYETNCNNLGGTASQCADSTWAAGPASGTAADTVLLNGMTRPVIELSANTWYRFRLLFVAVHSVITPWVSECTIRLLAKDGVYLQDMPRTITSSYMGPGSRADWAISCPPGSFAMNDARPNRAGTRNDRVVRTLATLAVTDDGAGESTLATASVDRPCYLVDLRGQAPSSTTALSLGPGLSINGRKYTNASTYEASFAVGQVHELRLSGLYHHAFHIHVNHFQLTSDPANTYGDYFKAGDWHDVLMMPSGTASVRFQADRFTGKQVVHCHSLWHAVRAYPLCAHLIATTHSVSYTNCAGQRHDACHPPNWVRRDDFQRRGGNRSQLLQSRIHRVAPQSTCRQHRASSWMYDGRGGRFYMRRSFIRKWEILPTSTCDHLADCLRDTADRTARRSCGQRQETQI